MTTRRVILALCAVLGAGAAALLLRAPATHAPDREPAAAAKSNPVHASEARVDVPSSTPGSTPPDALALARSELELAQAEVVEAREALRSAEQRLDDLEREVEAVEAFVADIEERGDDPARHAFDGMERLGPVIDRYEARLATVVEAEEAVTRAEARAARAEAELTAARASR